MRKRIVSLMLAAVLLIASLAAIAEGVDVSQYSQLEYGSKGNAVSEL